MKDPESSKIIPDNKDLNQALRRWALENLESIHLKLTTFKTNQILNNPISERSSFTLDCNITHPMKECIVCR